MDNFKGPGKTMPYKNITSSNETLASGQLVCADGVSVAGIVCADIADSATGTVEIGPGVYSVTCSAAAAYTIGLTNCKCDGSGQLLLNAATGVPNTALSNLRTFEANTSSTTIVVKLLG